MTSTNDTSGFGLAKKTSEYGIGSVLSYTRRDNFLFEPPWLYFVFQKSQLATSYQRYPQLNLISAISKIGGLFAAAKFLSLFLSFWHEARFERELKELTTTTTQEGGGEGTIEKSAKVI